MDLVKSVKLPWVGKPLNTMIDGVNARTLIQGDKMLFRETPGGVLISADIPAIQALIDKSVAAAVAANPPGGGAGGGGSGGGGTGGGGGSGSDQSGSGVPGDPGTWSFNSPVPVGDGVSSIYPNQQDLSSQIDSFVVTQSTLDGRFATSFAVLHDGTVQGGLTALPPGPYVFTITYHYLGGATVSGVTSPAFSLPPSGANIILGGHPFFIPNP